MPLEKPVSHLPGLRRIAADSGAPYAAAAIVAFLFAASGPVAIILAVGARGGLSETDIASWIFGAFFLNGAHQIAFYAALPAAARLLLDASRARCWSGRRSGTCRFPR